MLVLENQNMQHINHNPRHSTIDTDLCEDETTHTKKWKKHKDTINFHSINKVKL